MQMWVSQCHTIVKQDLPCRSPAGLLGVLASGSGELAQLCLGFASAASLSTVRVLNHAWCNLASVDTLWLPLAEKRWPGVGCLRTAGFGGAGVRTLYARRSHLERIERCRGEPTPPPPLGEEALSEFGVFAEFSISGHKMPGVLLSLYRRHGDAVEAPWPSVWDLSGIVLQSRRTGLFYQPPCPTGELSMTLVRRRDGLLKRVCSAVPIECIHINEGAIEFEVEAVELFQGYLWKELEGRAIENHEYDRPPYQPTYNYNCDLQGVEFDVSGDVPQKILSMRSIVIQLYSNQTSSFVQVPQIIRSFDLLGEWV